jgi:hypothetical protein
VDGAGGKPALLIYSPSFFSRCFRKADVDFPKSILLEFIFVIAWHEEKIFKIEITIMKIFIIKCLILINISKMKTNY